MKKLCTIFLAFALAFSVGTTIQTEAASPTDWWTEQDAKVSPYVYSYLLDNAGFAAYIYTDTKVSMNPQNLSNFSILEKHDNFFVGEFDSERNKVLVTKDGLVVAFSPKETAHSILWDDQHFTEIRDAVKIFVGPTISKANYINFQSLDSNKALAFAGSKGSLAIPSDSKINDIGYSYSTFHHTDSYGTVVAGTLQSGITHNLEESGIVIDKVKVFESYWSSGNLMNVFYTSNSPILVTETENYATFDLTNKFTPFITDAPTDKAVKEEINWAVMNGLIRGYEDGSFKPNKTLTESQFVSILAKYFSLNTSLDGESTIYNENGAYTYLKQYNLPLKGYTNVKERNKPVTRGVVAQVLSMTQGGPSSLVGAYEFLYSNKLTNATTLNAYKSNEGLKRSQISSFFKRMDNADLVQIK